MSEAKQAFDYLGLWQVAIPTLTTVFLVCALIFYRLKKRFKKEDRKGFWLFLDHNIVELIIGGIAIPDLIGIVMNAL